MAARQINSEISVSEQISPEDLPELARQGFRSIICNRPDGEGPDQPSFAEIAQAAKAAGIKAAYLPVQAGAMQEEDAVQFAELLTQLPLPVLAYCRSGSRSANLWAMSQAVSGKSASVMRR